MKHETMRALVARLERSGWTVERAMREPEKKYPVPSPPYAPGRHYHLVANMSVGLLVDHGRIIASLPPHDIYRELQEYSPELLEGEALIKVASSVPQVHVTGNADLTKESNLNAVCLPSGKWTLHKTFSGTWTVLHNQDVIGEWNKGTDIPDGVVPEPVLLLAEYLDEKEEK